MSADAERIAAYYDGLVDRYGHHPRAVDASSRTSLDVRYGVLAAVGDMSGRSVLEVGCGFGDLGVQLRERYAGLRYRGIDLSPRMIEEGRRVNPGLELDVLDVLDVPAGEAYDYVLAQGIFYLLREDPEARMRAIVQRMFALATEAVAFTAISDMGLPARSGRVLRGAGGGARPRALADTRGRAAPRLPSPATWRSTSTSGTGSERRGRLPIRGQHPDERGARLHGPPRAADRLERLLARRADDELPALHAPPGHRALPGQARDFKRVLGVHGSVVECGVFFGGGLMGWAQLSAIYEPVNHQRRVIGFDTFEGFPGMAGEDTGSESAEAHAGGLAIDSYGEIARAAELFDGNRPIGHIPKVELVRGDATETIPRFVAENPQLIVSLLYLDFDIHAPTKVALEHFLPRMPKGAIVAFDELNLRDWPGESIALLESVDVRRLELERLPIGSTISFARLDGPVS